MPKTNYLPFLEPTFLSFCSTSSIIIYCCLMHWLVYTVYTYTNEHSASFHFKHRVAAFLSNQSVNKSISYWFIYCGRVGWVINHRAINQIFIHAGIKYILFSSLHLPGGIGPKFRGVHHIKPGRKRLRRQTEASRQPKAAVQARGHEQAR